MISFPGMFNSYQFHQLNYFLIYLFFCFSSVMD